MLCSASTIYGVRVLLSPQRFARAHTHTHTTHTFSALPFPPSTLLPPHAPLCSAPKNVKKGAQAPHEAPSPPGALCLPPGGEEGVPLRAASGPARVCSARNKDGWRRVTRAFSL
jgi:hypothetical protein